MKRNVFLSFLSIIVLTGLFMNGCGGGGGGGDGTDITSPTVVSTVPAIDATGVAINSAITATFSEDMDPATITASTFTLELQNGGLTATGARTVSATVSYSMGSRTAILTPDEDFAYYTWYKATITTGVTDLAGNALAEVYTWSFTSGQNPDTTAPWVVSTIPGADAIDVSPEITEITVTFSEDMNPETMHQDSCGIVDTESQERLGGLSYADRTLVIQEQEGLQYNRTYEGYVKSSVADLAGNELGEDYTWTFSTEVDTMPPSIVSVWPEPDEEHQFVFDMTPRRPLTVTFDDDMNEGSINYETYYIKEYDGGDYLDVNFGLTYEDRTAYMTVGGDEEVLDFNTAYYVTVNIGIQDKAGNDLYLDGESAVSWGIERRQAGEPELNDGQDNYNTGYHRIAVRPVSDEDYVMVWVQIHDEEDKTGTIWAEYWDASAGEGGEYQGNTILSEVLGEWVYECAEPRVVMDDDGNATAVWLQGYEGDDCYENVYAARLPSGGTWGAPEIISNPGETSTQIESLDIAVDGIGAIVVWDQITDDDTGNIWSNYYDGSWGEAEEVSANGASWGYANSPCIVVDSEGGGRAFWHQHNLAETGNIHTLRTRSGTTSDGWHWEVDEGPPVVPIIDEISVTTKQTGNVVAAEDGSGNYMALWLQDDDGDGFTENLWSCYYYSSEWQSPYSLTSVPETTLVGFIDFDFDSATGNGVAVWWEITGFYEETNLRYDLFSGGGESGWSGSGEIYESEDGIVALPVVQFPTDGDPVCVFAHGDLQTYGRLMYTKHNGTEWDVVSTFEEEDLHMPAMQISGDDVNFEYLDELSIGIDSSDMLHAVWADGPADYEANSVSNHFFVGTEEEPPPVR